jgi:hypothetical protein
MKNNGRAPCRGIGKEKAQRDKWDAIECATTWLLLTPEFYLPLVLLVNKWTFLLPFDFFPFPGEPPRYVTTAPKDVSDFRPLIHHHILADRKYQLPPRSRHTPSASPVSIIIALWAVTVPSS